MDKDKKLILILALGMLASIVLTYVFRAWADPQPMGKRTYFDLFLNIKVFVSTLNIILITVLLWNYLTLYREIPNRFTLSLIIFSTALMLYAFSSNPIITQVLGFKHDSGLGPFTFLPDIFAAVAVSVLLHQSYE